MSRHRRPSRKSKYYIDPLLFDYTVNFSRMYSAWKKELAGDIDPDRQEDLSRRIGIIEEAAGVAAGDDVMKKYLLQAITQDLTFLELQGRGIPCERKTFYRVRRVFFWEISRKIK